MGLHWKTPAPLHSRNQPPHIRQEIHLQITCSNLSHGPQTPTPTHPYMQQRIQLAEMVIFLFTCPFWPCDCLGRLGLLSAVYYKRKSCWMGPTGMGMLYICTKSINLCYVMLCSKRIYIILPLLGYLKLVRCH